MGINLHDRGGIRGKGGWLFLLFFLDTKAGTSAKLTYASDQQQRQTSAWEVQRASQKSNFDSGPRDRRRQPTERSS